MAVTIRPAMGLQHTEQTRAGEDFVLTWTFGQDFSTLVGGSGGKESEGTEIEGALIIGTEIEGALIRGAGGSGSEMDRSSTLGK